MACLTVWNLGVNRPRCAEIRGRRALERPCTAEIRAGRAGEGIKTAGCSSFELVKYEAGKCVKYQHPCCA